MATTRKKDAPATRQRRNGHTASSSKSSSASGGSAEVFFEALAESAEALFTAGRASNARAHRLSQAAISDIQLAQRDAIHIARTWAESPLDLLGWYTAIVETAVGAQSRVAERARNLWEELAQAREETQQAFQRSAQANWRAGRAAFGLVGEAFTARR
jgi:hypothetical protein